MENGKNKTERAQKADLYKRNSNSLTLLVVVMLEDIEQRRERHISHLIQRHAYISVSPAWSVCIEGE